MNGEWRIENEFCFKRLDFLFQMGSSKLHQLQQFYDH